MEILLVEADLSDAQITYQHLNRTHIHHRLTMLWNGAEGSISCIAAAFLAGCRGRT